MAKISKTLAVLAVLALVAVGVGLLVAWYMGSHGTVAPVAFDPKAVPPPPPVPAPVWLPAPQQTNESAKTTSSAPGSNFDPAPPDTRPWDQQLEEILLDGTGNENDKSDKILGLLTNAAPDAQIELSQHLINMTQDDHYDGVAGLLTNATTQTAVSTILMNDLLNRKNTLKLPMLLAIARNQDHPLAGQAKDMLELFIQTDYGTNWDQWSDALTSWLQQNDQ